MRELEALRQQTEEYIGQVFDHVSNLGHTHLLGHLYDFQATIDSKIKELKNDKSAD